MLLQCALLFSVFFLMIRRPPRSTRTDTLFPYTTLFRSVARIAGVNIPTNKRVVIALTYIHGIGDAKAQEICGKVGIPAERRVNQLTDSEVRSEEHTSELQSLMRISYAVFCLTKKKKQKQTTHTLHGHNYTESYNYG